MTETMSSPPAPPAVPPAPLRARSFRTGRTITALILREMTTSYGRSPGGYLWAVLEPVGAVLLLSLGFSLLLRSPPLGTSFLLFYATGYLPFSLYMQTSNLVARSLNFSRPLLAYPGVTWIDAILARFILTTLTQLMVFCVVIGGILLAVDTHTVLHLPRILLGLGMAAATGLGIGTLNCFLLSMLPVWTQIWSIAMRPAFLASGIFFIYEDLPRVAQDILWWNPILHANGMVRTGFFASYDATYVNMAFVLGVSGICFALGLVLLGRFHREILSQ